MLKALERDIVSMNERVVLLAPSVASVDEIFQNVDVDQHGHDQLVRDVQKLRGGIYLKDGAIQSNQLSSDGLHQTPEDENGWHMLLLDKKQRLNACALYLEHDSSVSFEELRVRQCPLAENEEWRPRLRKAIHSELARARRERLQFVELGGWAVSEESRGTAGPLALALAVYGFSRRCGGALGMTTATFRHCSATILKRLGGSRFEIDGATLPPYFDARYQCMMEMIRFDSRSPNPKYIHLIEQARQRLARVLVIARPDSPASQPNHEDNSDVYQQPFLPSATGFRARAIAS
jgi:hypothetical protein